MPDILKEVVTCAPPAAIIWRECCKRGDGDSYGIHLYPNGYSPQTRHAPRPHTRRRPAASHGVAAPAGMALATVLDSANG